MQDANALTMPSQVRGASMLAAGPNHRQPGTRTGYIGITEALRIIRRRRWPILLVVVGTLLAALVFLAHTLPVYSSTTTVMVLPSDQTQAAPAAAAPTTAPSASEEAAIQTKVELLQSRALAKQAAQSLQLDKDREFAPGPGGPGLMDRLFSSLTPSTPVSLNPRERLLAAERARSEAITDNLIDHISVQRIARSNVISITASSTDPVKAARIANRWVDLYIRDEIEDVNSGRNKEIVALRAQVAEVRTHLQHADSQTAAYRHDHGLLSSQPEVAGSAQASALAGLLAQAKEESAGDSRKAQPTRMPNGGISASSPLLTDLQQQEAILARKTSQLTSFYGPRYPEVVQTAAELAALRTHIAQETARIGADLRNQASASYAKSGSMAAALAGIRSSSLNEGQAAVPLRALERNVDAVNTLYTTLLNQLNAKIASPAVIDADISRVSRAPVPDSPSYPLPKRVLAVAAAAALGLGTLLAFLIEMMDTRLRTAEQVQRLFGIPTLAMIPELGDQAGPIHSAVAGRPRSLFAEAMRNLLIELESRTEPEEGSRVVVMTSPLEGEGKNTVATSLAAAAAVVGRHVVIVDFDLRRPGILPANADASDKRGVVAYLRERAVLEDLVVEQASGFTVIGVGESATDPGALIASPRLPQLLAQLRERFELVILNAPPILPVRDAKTLADHADAVVLVLRWGQTSPEAAAAAIEIFSHPITGAVINRVDYAVHANRRYGDAIHHVARSVPYYEVEPDAGRWFDFAKTKRSLRRVTHRAAQALHIA